MLAVARLLSSDSACGLVSSRGGSSVLGGEIGWGRGGNCCCGGTGNWDADRDGGRGGGTAGASLGGTGGSR